MSVQDLALLLQTQEMESACQGGEYHQCGSRC
jgi:hypothetical protein